MRESSSEFTFSFFMGSQVCHIVVYQLCSHGEIDANELQLYVYEVMTSEGKPVSLHVINNCVSWLKREGLATEELDAPREFHECIKKYKKRTCMRKYPARVLLRATPRLCRALVDHAQSLGALGGWEWWPVWARE